MSPEHNTEKQTEIGMGKHYVMVGLEELTENRAPGRGPGFRESL